MNKTQILLIILGVVIIGGILYIGSVEQTNAPVVVEDDNTEGSNEEQSEEVIRNDIPNKGKAIPTQPPSMSLPTPGSGGRIVFGVKDSPTTLSSVKSIVIKLDALEVWHEDNGWSSVPLWKKEFNLLELKNNSALALIADKQITLGDYTHLRLRMKEVTLTWFDGSSKEAFLPSRTLEFFYPFEAVQGKTSVIEIDFDLAESLYGLKGGGIIFLPTVTLSGHGNADVRISAEDNVSVVSGTNLPDETLRMDVSGVAQKNTVVDKYAVMELLDGVVKVIPQNQKEEGLSIVATEAISIAKDEADLSDVRSITLITTRGVSAWRIVGIKIGQFFTVDVSAESGAILD